MRDVLAPRSRACWRRVAQMRSSPGAKPHVILVVGVNGTGKTTTIGKLAHVFRRRGKKVMLAAGDTFRAAAIEQLKIWGERTAPKSSPSRPAPIRQASPSRRSSARATRAPMCC